MPDALPSSDPSGSPATTNDDSAGITYDVVGIGNALVDVLSHESEEFLQQMALSKGAMQLIDTDQADALYRAMGDKIEASGGSGANTLAGIASFGGRAAFMGRVHQDTLGAVFAHDMASLGVHFDTPRAHEGAPTGRCLIVVSPDAERTLNTYLGASADFSGEHVDLDLIAASGVTFLEGYLFDSPPAKEAYRVAADAAHAAGRKVALTLSDGFCVERHRDDFQQLVKGGVDILFANEDEITRLYQVDTFEEAVKIVRGSCEIACLTRGAAGSVIVTADEVVEVAAHPLDKVVDTTGAGDLYAAGFLFGYSTGRDLAESGRLGSMAASAVLGHTGARPGLSLDQLLHGF